MDDLFGHWRDEPPLAQVVKQYLGVGPKSPARKRDVTPKEVTEEQWEALLQESKAFAGHFKGPQG